MKQIALIIVCAVFFVSGCTSTPVVSRSSELPYSYSRLKLLDIDEMTEIVQNHISQFRRSKQESVMKEALVISLSRPNDDNLLEKLLNSVRFSLETNDQWESLVESVVDDSIAKLKNETTAPEDQVTYLTLLSNLVLEFKPEFFKPDVSPVFEKNITAKIAEAQIIVSDVARKESSMNSMYSIPSPSDIAQSTIHEIQTKAKSK